MVIGAGGSQASQRSDALSFQRPEPRGQMALVTANASFAGTNLLRWFYTVIAGWLLYYFVMLGESFTGLDAQGSRRSSATC